MKKTQHVSVRVSDDQKEALERLARSREVSVAHLMRQAVLELSEVSQVENTTIISKEVPPTPRRDAELALLDGEGERIRRFAGQWIALNGDQIVSHGTDYIEVYREARESGVRVPFVEWIPERAPDSVWIGL